MRSSTLISLAVAILLAILAVAGARTWLAGQRAAMQSEAAAQDKGEERVIVVAAATLGFGERLTADKLTTLEWASDQLPEGAFTEMAALVGTGEDDARYVLSSIAKGEIILPSKITSPGQRAKLSTSLTPGMKAVSIRVNDVLGVAGFVLPGDRVDVMLTREDPDGGQSFVDVLLQGVRVVAIDQIADDRKDQPSVVRTVTFEVTTEEAQKLTLGANIGTLSLALRNLVSTAEERTERVTMSDLDRAGAPRQVAPTEAELAAAARIAALEAELVKLQETIAEGSEPAEDPRIAELEALLKDLQAQAEAPPPAPETVAPLPEGPSFVSVGVVRGGQRAEYQVIYDDK